MTIPTISCASMNLGNLGEWSHPNKLTNLLHVIIHELELPMIIAVQEIGGQSSENKQNDNISSPDESSPLSEQKAVEATIALSICEALSSAAPENYSYHYIDIPPLPNSSGGQTEFNIRCGIFYRSDLSPQKAVNIGENHAEFIGDSTLLYLPSRFPLAVNFSHQHSDFWIINCHLKSMNAPTRKEKKIARRQRKTQVRTIIKFLHSLDEDDAVLIVGDMNDTPNSETIQLFLQEELCSTWQHYDQKQYSYKHRGKPLVLDYIFINPMIKLVHGRVLHLNTNEKYEHKYSDHDPLLLTFTL